VAKESTAVANLLELMARRPIERYSEQDILFAGPAKAAAARPNVFDETHAVTHRVRRVELHDLRKPLLVATVIVSAAAVAMTAYKLTRSRPAAAATALTLSVAPPPPAPPPKPIVVEAIIPTAPPPIAPKPALVDLTLDSKPAGATVTMIDHGASTIAGTTPLAMSVDPAHEVDLTFSLAGQEPKTVHVDPKTMKKVTVELAVVEPEPAAPVAARKKPSSSGGSGTLMVSTKPPCEIAIDGKSTGLVSPQRSITVAAGRHQITFTNTQQHIKKTVAVAVTANHSTKLIRDLMSR
jgi:hypothetical protein